MKRAFAVVIIVVSAGCLQLTGVADYKVEEACVITPGNPCRVAPNCGCTGADTCELTGVNGEGACKPSGGTPRGGACSANTECAKGMLCLGGFCTTYCRNDNDCADKACEAIALGGAQVNGVGFCATPCDPGNPTCGDGRACRLIKNERAVCVTPGTVGVGGTCEGDGPCQPGLYCSSGACVPLCRSGEECATGTCEDLGVTYKGTPYGLCPRGG